MPLHLLSQSQPRAPDAGVPRIAAGAITLLLFIAIAIFLIRRRRSVPPPDSEGSCGRCGYLVKGLTTFTCPECGSDLRQVGLIHPRNGDTPRAGAPWLIVLKASARPLLIWIVSCLIFSAVCTWIVRDYLWPYSDVGENVIHCYPKSRRYTSAKFYTRTEAPAFGRIRAARAPQKSRYGQFEMQDATSTWLIGVNYLADNHYYRDASGTTVTHAGLPTSASVLDFLKINKIDTSDPRVQAEAAAAAAVMADAGNQPNLNLRLPPAFPFDITSSAGAGGIVSGGGAAFEEAQNIVWPLLLSSGILIILWRRRRALLAAGVIPARGSRQTERAAPADSNDSIRTGTRTLSILFSDIKDYTARTAAGSRQAAIELVRRHRDLVQPIVKTHGGRIIKTIGDALLVTFDSATDAVLAGAQIQGSLREHNTAAFKDADRFELRIAVSTGEVVVESNDVFGEAVNLASRVQQLAAAGEVLLTEPTWAMVNKREVPCEEAGVFELKGIPGTVRVFRAVPAGTAAAIDAEARS